MLTKFFQTKMSAMDGERSVVAKISTTSVDRQGDVVLPSGGDFRDFQKNPVVLFGHDSSRIPIGKATEIERSPNGVTAKVAFAERPKEHPEQAEWVPDTVMSLFQQGVLNAFSIGFTVPPGGSRDPDTKDFKRFGDDVRRIIKSWKLVEFSVVPIPANQDALAIAVSKGIVDELSWTWDELEQTKELPGPRRSRLVLPVKPRLKL